MRTPIAPVNQTHLAQTTIAEADADSVTVRHPPASRTPALLLAILITAVMLLSSASAKMQTTGGEPTVTTGGQPMVTTAGQLYALINPVQRVPLPHVEVDVDGYLITPSTCPGIIMELSTPEQPNTLKLEGQAVYADGTVDPNGTVVFSLVPNGPAGDFLAAGGRVTSDGSVTASTVIVLGCIDVKASLASAPWISETIQIQVGRLDSVIPGPIIVK